MNATEEGRNILLIDHYAGSPSLGMEYRAYYLARAWQAAGNTVTTVAGSYSHLRRVNPPVGRTWQRQESEAGVTLWVPTPRYHGNGLRRVASMFSFVSQLMTHAPWLVETVRPDLVIASSTYPLDIYPAARIARFAQAALVFEVHDLWPLTLVEVGGIAPDHPFVRLLQWAEDHAYRRADAVVSLLPAAMEHMVQHGMTPGKFIYVPNGTAVEEWGDGPDIIPPGVAATVRALRSGGRCLVLYAGTLGEANALDRLLAAAALLPPQQFAFLIVGQGPCLASLQQESRRLGLENVAFVPSLERSAIPSLLRQADVLYAGGRPLPLYRYGTSFNKVVDYMMAGRPVVTVTAGAEDPVALAGCGCAVQEDSVAAAAAALRQLGALSREQRDRLGERGRSYAQEHFAYPVLARDFLRGVDAVTGTVVRDDKEVRDGSA